MKHKVIELTDYNFDEPEPPMTVRSPKNYWDHGKKRAGEWPGLGEDSYVWYSLKNYGNTSLGYRHGVALLKHVYHLRYSPHTPPGFMSDEKYLEQRNDCLGGVAKYISETIGKPVRIQLVHHENGLRKCMIDKNLTEEERSHLGDSWLVEVLK